MPLPGLNLANTPCVRVITGLQMPWSYFVLGIFYEKSVQLCFMQKKYRVWKQFFDKHGLNFNHLHANNNNDDDLKKFYRAFIVYRLFLDNLDI